MHSLAVDCGRSCPSTAQGTEVVAGSQDKVNKAVLEAQGG